MKFLLSSLLLIVFGFNGLSQEFNFRLLDNNELVWIKTYNSKSTFKEILLALKKNGKFSNIDTAYNSVFGEIKRMPFLYGNSKENSKSQSAVIVFWSDFTATFELNFKEDSYQVVVKNISFVGKQGNATDNFLIQRPNEVTPLIDVAIKNNLNEFKKPFLKNIAPFFEYNFNLLFSTVEVKNYY